MRVIVLRTVKHHGRALEGLGIGGVAEIAAAEVFGDHTRLHDRRIEQIAAQHQEARVLAQRIRERTNHLRVLNLMSAAVLGQRAAIDCQSVLADEPVLEKLVHHRRHATRMMIVLAQIRAGGL